MFQKAITIEQKPGLAHLTPIMLLAITVLGAILRLLEIGSKGLWLDEAFSVWMGWQSITEMFAWLIQIDQHPPLYYFLLHFWMYLGDSAVMVRTFSALLGGLTIPVIYLLGQRLAGWKVGLLAALILALSPFHVRFAQETRMYTLLTLNASLAMLALAYLLTDCQAQTIRLGQQLADFYQTWRADHTAEAHKQQETGVGYRPDFRKSTTWVSAPTRRRWQAMATDLAWIGYILFTVATMLTHNTAVFFPLAANLFVFGLILVRRRRAMGSAPLAGPASEEQLQPPALNNWLIAQLATFLLWSPWLAAFFVQAVRVDREFWIWAPTFGSAMGAVGNFLSAFFPTYVKWGNVIWPLYGLLILLGLLHFRKKPAHAILLLTLFLTPFVGELLVSLRRPIFYDRTLIWATIPLYLLLAAGLIQLRYRPYILAAIIILVVGNGFSLREYFVEFEKEQWDDAAAHVAQHVDNKDLLLFNATWVQIPFDFYFRHFNRPVAKHGVPADLFDRGILEPKMAPSDLPRLRRLIRGHERVWLIYSHNWYTDPQNLIPKALRQELKLLKKQHFYGLEIHLYSIFSNDSF